KACVDFKGKYRQQKKDINVRTLTNHELNYNKIRSLKTSHKYLTRSSVAIALTKVIGTKRAILGVVVSSAVLTYGGVSLFVVVFAVYPLALTLFKEANISRKLIPGTVALGAFTFTMTALPGTPQIQNLIPMEYFETSAT